MTLLNNKTCVATLTFDNPNSPTVLTILLSLVAAFAIIVTGVNLVQFLLVIPKGAIHVNYRILFISSTIVAFLDGLLCVLFLVYHLTGVLYDDKWQGITEFWCHLGIGLRSFMRGYQFFCLFFSGLERYFSALRKSFVDPKRMTVVGLAMFAASAIVPLLFLVAFVVKMPFRNQYCYCMNQLYSSKVGLLNIAFNLVIIWVASGAAFALHRAASKINRKVAEDFHMDTTCHSLEERYVVSSNLKLGNVLATFVTVQTIMESYNVLVATISFLWPDLSHEKLVAVKTNSYFSALLNSFLQAVVLDFKHDVFNRRLRKLFGIGFKIEPFKESNDEDGAPNQISREPEDPMAANGIIGRFWEEQNERNLKKSENAPARNPPVTNQEVVESQL